LRLSRKPYRPRAIHLTIDLLRRMIANRIQEEAFGTLDRATLKLLDGLARRDGARRGERNLKIGTDPVHMALIIVSSALQEPLASSDLTAFASATRRVSSASLRSP
jgi:hypothetical protein